MGWARGRWSGEVLGKVRLGALAFGLFTCLGPLNVLESSFPPGRRLVSVVCLVTLVAVFALSWRRNRTFWPEPAAAAPLALGASYGLQDSMIVIAICLGVAASQSLYGGTAAFVVRTLLLVPVVPLAVTLTPSAGRELTWSSSQVLTQSVLPPLVALLMRTLRSALLDQERALVREQVMATTGRDLLGLTDVTGVRAIMGRAAAELCRVTPELVLVSAELKGGRLSVTATHGLSPPEPDVDLPIDLLRVAGNRVSTTPVPPEHLVAVRLALGTSRHWYVMGMDVDDDAPRDLVVIVGLGDRTPEGVLALLTTLGTQRSLAERACHSHGELAYQAHHDHLTGLPNRGLLFRELDRALAAARNGRSAPVVLMIVDLDGFKGVNDTRGHAAGDAVLIEVGLRMRALFADVGVAARLGGDEFAVLLSGRTVPEATDLAGRLATRIGDPIELPDDAGSVHIGGSIGLAVAGATTDAGKLMGLADVAMYAAKTGGSGVEVFSAEPQIRA